MVESVEQQQNKKVLIKLYPENFFNIELKEWTVLEVLGSTLDILQFQHSGDSERIDARKMETSWFKILAESLWKNFGLHNPPVYWKSILLGKLLEIWLIEDIFIDIKWEYIFILLDNWKLLKQKLNDFLQWNKKFNIDFNSTNIENYNSKLGLIMWWDIKVVWWIISRNSMFSNNFNLPGKDAIEFRNIKEECVFITYDDNDINFMDINDSWYKTLQTESLSTFWKIVEIRIDQKKNFLACIFETPDGWYKLEIFRINHNIPLDNSSSCLEHIYGIPDVKKIVGFDSINHLYVTDKNDKLRKIETNMQDFEEYDKSSVELEVPDDSKKIVVVSTAARDAVSALSAPLKLWEQQLIDDWLDELREKIWNIVFEEYPGKTFKQLFDEADTEEKINIVRQMVEKLSLMPEIMRVTWLIQPVQAKVHQKWLKIKTDIIESQLWDIEKQIKSWDWFENLLRIQDTLKSFQAIKSQVNTWISDQDQVIKWLLSIVDQKIEEVRASKEDEVLVHIEIKLWYLKDYLSNVVYAVQITSVYNSQIWEEIMSLTNLLSDEKKDIIQDKMKNMVTARLWEINSELQKIERKTKAQVENNIRKIKWDIKTLKTILATIKDENVVSDMMVNDAFAKNILAEISKLPANKSWTLSVEFENIFSDRILDIQMSKDQVDLATALDSYGIPKSLYFTPEVARKVTWELKWKHQADGRVKIYFESNTGLQITPDINKRVIWNYPFKMSEDDFIELRWKIAKWRRNWDRAKYKLLSKELAELKKQLYKYEISDSRYVKLKEEISKSTFDDATYQNLLGKLSELRQSDQNSVELRSNILSKQSEIEEIRKENYIAIMLGSMDRTSNSFWELSARPDVPKLSSRTVIWPSVQEFLKKAWYVLSKQLEYQQWIMIVESDAWSWKNFKLEILANLTNRELFDISCNSSFKKEDLLFTWWLSEEWATYRTPTQLIKALQTPWAIICLDEINTLPPWVAKILNPLLDGRRYINDPILGKIHAHPSVMIVWLMNPRSYIGTNDLAPEFVSRSRIITDRYPDAVEEAYMTSKYFKWNIAKLTYEQFKTLWSKYVIGREDPKDKSISDAFKAMDKLTKVAAEIRDINTKTRKWEDIEIDEEIKFIFTVRDSIYVIQDFTSTWDIKLSIKDVILTKIPDLKHKENAEKVIDRICS